MAMEEPASLDFIITFFERQGYKENTIKTFEPEEFIQKLGHELVNKLKDYFVRLRSGNWKDRCAAALFILGCLLGIPGLFIPKISLTSSVVIFAGCILRFIFDQIDLKDLHVLEIDFPQKDEILHEIAGLTEMLKHVNCMIDDLEMSGNQTQESNVFKSVLKIGLLELGSLKSRIRSLMVPIESDLQKCLLYLTLFVRIVSFRHLLLLRCMDVFNANSRDESFVRTLRKCLDREKKENTTFLSFLSTPTIRTAVFLTVFNPKEKRMEEVVEYLGILKLSPQNLSDSLNTQVFEVGSVARPHVVLGRALSLFSYIKEMDASRNENNPRIQFQFIAVDVKNACNLFKIKLVGKDAYMYLTESGYCKYSKLSPDADNFQWHVIGVHNVDEKGKIKDEKNPDSFMLCTKRWPGRIVCMNRSRFKFATGMVCPENISTDNVFTLKGNHLQSREVN